MAAWTAPRAGMGHRNPGGLVALTQHDEGGVAAHRAERLDGQGGHFSGAEAHHAAEHGDGVMGRSQAAGSSEEGGVLEDGEHLAALQLARDLRPGNARAGVGRNELLLVGQAVEAGHRVIVRGDRGPREPGVGDGAQPQLHLGATGGQRIDPSVGAPPTPTRQVDRVGPLGGGLVARQPPGGEVVPDGMP
jgi:hypothetical protein